MILCDFCDERASFAFESAGIVWAAFGARVAFCRWHLTIYYLSFEATWND